MLSQGQVFAGRYRVGELLGSGGMGDVYQAVDTRTDAAVALKVLRPHVIADINAERRFQLEAKVKAWVQSEHIVHVLDADFGSAPGAQYLVMELLRGETLAQRVRHAGPLAPEAVVALLRQVARGLDAAHARRDSDGRLAPIVHRDLKPENLFLSELGDGSTCAKILDFGVATTLGESNAASRVHVGTAQYMAYEYLHSGASSPSMDLWALSLIAHFALTGRSYWRTANDPHTVSAHLIKEIISSPLEPPSLRLGTLGANLRLPPEFDAWLLRCLDPEPRRRFGTALATVDALEAVFAGSLYQQGRVLAERYELRDWIWRKPLGALYLSVDLQTQSQTWLRPMSSTEEGNARPGKSSLVELQSATPSSEGDAAEAVDVIFDVAAGVHCQVFEILRGATLARRVELRGPMSASAFRALLPALAKGLVSAESMRPEQLFLASAANGSTSLKFLDTVLAPSQRAVDLEAPLGVWLAQLAAAAEPARSNRALGLVTHFALTGESLWRTLIRSELRGPALAAAILSLAYEPPRGPPPPSPWEVAVTDAFRSWVMACLELDPSRRFGSPADAVSELELLLGGVGFEPLAARDALGIQGIPVTTAALPASSVPSTSAPVSGSSASASVRLHGYVPKPSKLKSRFAAAGSLALGLLGLAALLRALSALFPANPPADTVLDPHTTTNNGNISTWPR